MTKLDTTVIEEALELVRPESLDVFTGQDASRLLTHDGGLIEYVVGESLREFLDRVPALEKLRDGEGNIRVGEITLRSLPPLDNLSGKGSCTQQPFRFVVLDKEGTPRFQLIGSRLKENVVGVSLRAVAPDGVDYPYADKIATSRFVEAKDRSVPRSVGSCTAKKFGVFVSAMETLRPMIESIPLKRPELSVQDQVWARSEYFNFGDLLAADGGLAGDHCLEVVKSLQREVAVQTMGWVNKIFPEAVNEMKRKGIVWGQRFANYNDLDSSTCAIPLEDGRLAMIHAQNNMISHYWAWLAVAQPMEGGSLGEIALHAISRRGDSIPEVVRQLQTGTLTREPNMRYDFATGEVHMLEDIDHSGVLGDFAFYLECDHEMLFTGQNGELAFRAESLEFGEWTPFAPYDDCDLNDDPDVVGLKV